ICTDPLEARMAGIAIRYTNLAKYLSRDFEVTLWAPKVERAPEPTVRVWQGAGKESGMKAGALDEFDLIIAPPMAILLFLPLLETTARVVFDLTDPIIFENLHLFPGDETRMSAFLELYQLALWSGQHFLAANERQRDLWLTILLASRRVPAEQLTAPSVMENYFSLFPTGVPDEPFEKNRMAAGPPVILWSGGAWEWMDPLTPIEAYSKIAERVPHTLVYLGMNHPSGYFPLARRAKQAMELARNDTRLGGRVEFYDWIEYEKRTDYYRRAEVGISCHPDGLEAYYAYRTRLLDYLWAGLPVVCTEGETLGDAAAAAGAALLVRPEDPGDVADKLMEVLLDGSHRAGMAQASWRLGESLKWSRTVADLNGRLQRLDYKFPKMPRDILDGKYNGISEALKRINTPWNRVGTVLKREGWGGVVRRLRKKTGL
ncbi:MAG: glycosyltransferase, partial [bacterium]